MKSAENVSYDLWAATIESEQGAQYTMDTKKCAALKTELEAQPEPQVVPAERFFDGNDDTGSIGCNLSEHPGIAAFHKILTGLEGRSDVQAVYAQITELNPGEDSWPFTDTVLVAGTISTDDLNAVVSSLEPDDVSSVADFGASAQIAAKHGTPVHVIWWD